MPKQPNRSGKTPKAADVPMWKGYALTALRHNPHYTAGYHRGFPYRGTTDEDRAAYALGKDEARLSRNFNLLAGF